MKRALITGVFGQDGSYLTELLLKMGYEVHGVTKQHMSGNSSKIRQYLHKNGIEPVVHSCDLNSYADVRSLLETLKPDECYHLAATHYSSEVPDSEKMRIDTDLFHSNVTSTLNLLCSLREGSQHTKFVLAGSCLMYDASDRSPQNEEIPYASNSTYGLSKITASQLVTLFRNSYDMDVSTAILYNHESPRRPYQFVTKKIVNNMVKIANNNISHFEIGDLQSVRDWGYAKDYVFGMWLMCQQIQPKDYILATGEGHTVEDFHVRTAEVLGIQDWRQYVQVKAELTRPPVQTALIGDPILARTELKWNPTVSFDGLVELMVVNEVKGELD